MNCKTLQNFESDKLKNANALKAYFRSLPVSESPKQRENVAKVCGVRLTTVNNWCSGAAKIPESAMDAINNLAGRNIFEG